MAFTDKILSPLLSPLKRALKEEALPKLVERAEKIGLGKPAQTFAELFDRGEPSKASPPVVKPTAPTAPVVPKPIKLPEEEALQATPDEKPAAAGPPASALADEPITLVANEKPTETESFAQIAETPGAIEPTPEKVAEMKPEPEPVPMPKAKATKKPAAKAKPAKKAATNGTAKKAAPAKKKPAAKKKVAKTANGVAKKKTAAAAKSVDWPLLAAAVKSKKLVLAGGIAKKPVQDWLEASLGAAAHWTDTSGTGTRSVAGLELAIQRGGVAAVVLLEGSISHAESERVIAACKKAKVPLARGKRGGRQSLKDALTALEKAVAKTAN